MEGLTDLSYLSARDCGLTDISVLSDIKTLEYILLGFNEITNVPPQLGANAEGRGIYCLDLAQNKVSDITPLMTNCNCYDLVLVGNPITKYSTEKENCLLDRIWIDYFDGIENADLRPLDFMSVVGCPRKVMQPLSEKYFTVKFNTRAEQLELMKSTISSYTNYDGFEEEFLAIPEP